MARDPSGRSSRRARVSGRSGPSTEKPALPPDEEAAPAVSSRKSKRGKSAGSSKRKGKGKGKKRIDVMPVIMVALLLAAAGGAIAYFPMQKRTLRQAVAGGGRLGFDAAREISKSPSETSTLCRIVESSPSGRTAAAAALALMARRPEGGHVVGEIESRLKKGVTADAQAAYAAALAQSRTDAGEAAAAVVAAGGAPEAKRAAVHGLANGTTSAAAQAVGRALGDADPEVRKMAEGAVADWVVTRPERAAEAASAAFALDDTAAKVAAAKAMVAAARGLDPKALLPLLASESSQVRRLALEAAMAGNVLQQGDAEIVEAVVKLVDVDGQPPEVKLAALEAVAAGRIAEGGAKALDVLERDPDDEVRIKAVFAVGTTQPEGVWEALVRPLLRDDAPRPLRIACLEELGQKKVAPPDKLELVAGALLKHAEGDDETLAGLSLLALRMVTDRKDKKYNAEQWKTFIARRAFEFRMRREAKEVFAKLKKEYAEGKDDPDRVDEIVKAVYDAGRFLQNKAIPGANQDVKEALQDLRDEMKRFHDKIKGK